MRRALFSLAALASLSGLWACGPADGPVGWVVALKPASAEGWAMANGRAVGSISGRKVSVTLGNLPALEPETDLRAVLLVSAEPLRPLSPKLDAGYQPTVAYSSELPSATPDAGRFTSDAGTFAAAFSATPFELAHAAGLELEEVFPDGGSTVVLSGRIGNTDEVPPTTTAAPEHEGHHH